MKLIRSLVFVVCTGFLVSCATTTIPPELSNARRAYQQASEGSAAQLVPAELHKAKLALERAETSFLEDPKSYKTKDLAYAAEREAIKAEVLAAIASQKASTVPASKDYQAT